MNLFFGLFYVISGILFFYLVFPFLLAFFSYFFKEKAVPAKANRLFDFGCVITAYGNADISKPLILSLLKQQYERFTIYLVADACAVVDLGIHDDRLVILQPAEPLNLKVKSIMYAVDHFMRDHDYVVVLDSDNVVHPGYINEINRYANRGDICIQGQRTAKNLDTLYACADSTGEFYKNYVERVAPYLLGSSSVISGSGMAVETKLYKEYLRCPQIQVGQHQWKKMLQEDKILQNFIVGKNLRVTYAWNAIVYDEKVTTAKAVETQRSRWLFSYFQNIPNSSGLILKGLTRISFNQFLFGLITIAPPLFIQLFASVAVATVALFFNPWFTLTMIGGLCVFVGNIFLSLYLSRVPKAIWQAIYGIPLFIWQQVLALTKMRNPNKNFKHSEHTRTVYIDDLLKTNING